MAKVAPPEKTREAAVLFRPDDAFRDTIGTLDKRGKRNWIYPKRPKGRFHNARTWVTLGLLAFFFAGPHIRIGGHPLLMLNFLERRFVVIGQPFWPHDFHLAVIAFLIMIVGIALFTAAYGRIFCGWVCPQTLFMEMLFRKIEYWIEGDAGAQRRLNGLPWNAEKIRKKVLVNAVFYMVSMLVIGTFGMYLVGAGKVIEILSQGPSERPATAAGYVALTTAFCFVFARLREQVCIAACPYGRLQGVLLDRDSIVVAYDYARGEPRGKAGPKPGSKPVGDCVDCLACVRVCPTGIDIRNGTQLECVNCTACIDACDEIMDRLGRPRGLVRYASQSNIAEGRTFRFTGRMAFYSAILLVLVGALTYLLLSRADVETTLLRQPGPLFQTQPNGNLTNIYRLQFVNKTLDNLEITLKLEDPPGGGLRLQNSRTHMEVAPESVANSLAVLEYPRLALAGIKTRVVIGVYDGAGNRIDEIETAFLGPGPQPASATE